MAHKDQPRIKRLSPRSAVLDQRPEYERLGEWIRAQREAKGMQQRPLSRAMNKPLAFLNKVEHGHQRIDVVEFLDLWRALELPTNLTLAEVLAAVGHSPKSM